MNREPFEAGQGSVLVLHEPKDWTAVPPPLKRLVPPRMREAFRSFPGTFVALASQARHPGLRRFLEACSKGSCRLRLYETEDFGRAALLEVRLPNAAQPALLDFRTTETRTRRFPPSAPSTDPPIDIPSSLAEVHEALGGIQHQFGASGSLIPPDALRPLPVCWQAGMLDAFDMEPPSRDALQSSVAEGLAALRAEFEASGDHDSAMQFEALDMSGIVDAVDRSLRSLDPTHDQPFALEHWLRNCPGAPSLERAASMIPFYESSGDFLCFEPDGRATWIGWETAGVMPFGSVDEALDAYFDAITTDGQVVARFQPVSAR